jgi:Meiotically up-regulated gene 113
LSDLREDILTEIRRLAAAADGQPPGQNVFSNETGIAPHKWRGVFWAKWGDALIDAGFKPNNWQSKSDTVKVLDRFAELALTMGRIPTNSEIDLARRSNNSIPSSKYVLSHFGGKAELAKALIQLSKTEARFSALSDLITIGDNASHKVDATALSKDGWVYLFSYGRARYKIGLAKSVERRFVTLDGHSPDEMEIIWKIRTDDPAGIEDYWHKRFADKLIRKEYFELSKHDVAAFKRWKKIC